MHVSRASGTEEPATNPGWALSSSRPRTPVRCQKLAQSPTPPSITTSLRELSPTTRAAARPIMPQRLIHPARRCQWCTSASWLHFSTHRLWSDSLALPSPTPALPTRAVPSTGHSTAKSELPTSIRLLSFVNTNWAGLEELEQPPSCRQPHHLTA